MSIWGWSRPLHGKLTPLGERRLVDKMVALLAQARGQFELELHWHLAEERNLAMIGNGGGGGSLVRTRLWHVSLIGGESKGIFVEFRLIPDLASLVID